MYFSYAFAFGFAFLPNQTTAVVAVAKVGAIAKNKNCTLGQKSVLFLAKFYKLSIFKIAKAKGVFYLLVSLLKVTANCLVAMAVTTDGYIFATKSGVSVRHLGAYHSFRCNWANVCLSQGGGI